MEGLSRVRHTCCAIRPAARTAPSPLIAAPVPHGRMPRPALEAPPDNKGRVDAANRALWAQHRKARDADVKAQRKAREEREAEHERRDNHRLNRSAQAERDALQKQARAERNQAVKDMARKRKEAAEKAALAAAHGGR